MTREPSPQRYRKHGSDVRSRRIVIRVTSQEHSAIEDAARKAGLSMSAYSMGVLLAVAGKAG